MDIIMESFKSLIEEKKQSKRLRYDIKDIIRVFKRNEIRYKVWSPANVSFYDEDNKTWEKAKRLDVIARIIKNKSPSMENLNIIKEILDIAISDAKNISVYDYELIGEKYFDDSSTI